MLNLLGGSFVELPPTVIGQAYGGGFYAGQISTTANGVATHYLIVAPKASGETSGKAFRTVPSASDPLSVINGPSNSATMNDSAHPAALYCEGLSIGGYTDWYLPAKNELEVCYYFLKPTTQNNATAFGGSGSNANAVSPEPLNTIYTDTVPARTSATDFRSGGTEAFASQSFWTSTGNDDNVAWIQYFADGVQPSGFQNTANKPETLYVRAIRRVPIV
jgi:hypothetical protein